MPDESRITPQENDVLSDPETKAAEETETPSSESEPIPAPSEEEKKETEEREEEKPEGPAEEKPEEKTEEKPEASSPYLELALQAGVAPLEMRFSQINSCFRRLPIAYRSVTYINSVIEGVIPPEKYSFAADGTDRGMKLAKWNLRQAIRAIRSFEARGRHVDFVTARCPASLCLEDDLYEWMRSFLEEEDFHRPNKICLEFSQSLLYEDEEKVRASILGMKLLGVKTLMTGCGEKDCPVSCLIHIPVDYVLLAPWLTALMDSRGKSTSVSALLAYFRRLEIQVIGEGAQNDAQISALSRADSYGYIPSSGSYTVDPYTPPFFRMVRLLPSFPRRHVISTFSSPSSLHFGSAICSICAAYPLRRSSGATEYPMWPPNCSRYALK